MKKIVGKKFKKGAASFYVVAFSTLVLVIIAASFAAIIVSEITRTSNDDLAQSAYDSALAGVEDAKLAFYNYQRCLTDGSGELCSKILGARDNPGWMANPDCYMVGRILGRLREDEESEVMIQESKTAGNNMQQAYTCVKIETRLGDYRSTLTGSNSVKVMAAKFEDGVAERIKKVKISWFSDADGASLQYTNFSSGKVVFPSLVSAKASTPPTISLAMLQTAGTFNLSDFETTKDGRTDRGMVYLVPTDNSDWARNDRDSDTYIGSYDGSGNIISKSAMLKSNDKTAKNLPYAVYCSGESDFACEATIELPEPIGGTRNKDTFIFVTSLPYGKPNTTFSLEFFCNDGDYCGGTETVVGADGTITEEGTERAYLDGVQVGVDSTGRANDLFRRVEARLEGTDGFALSMMGPLELLGQNGKYALEKNDIVTSEWNF